MCIRFRNCSPLFPPLCTDEPSPEHFQTVTDLVSSVRPSAEVIMEMRGTALSTIKGYLSTIRDFLRFASVWVVATGTTWASVDALLEYIHHRIRPHNPVWPVFAYSAKASSGAKWLGVIPSTFARIGVRFPRAARPKMVKNAIIFAYPDGCEEHRPAIERYEFEKVLQAARTQGRATVTSVLCALMLFGMLRANEPLALSMNHHTLLHDGSGQLRGIAFQFFCKTHKQVRREIVFVRRNIWSAEFDHLHGLLTQTSLLRRRALRHRIIREHHQVSLFTNRHLQVLQRVLMAHAGHTLSCMRPGGLMFHVAEGQAQWLTIKQGGWSPKSKVFIEAYTRLGNMGAIERFEDDD